MIHARGLSCRASHRLIQRFDAFIGRKAEHGGWNVGTYYPVRPWECQAFRPYNGPHFLDNEDCKRRGGGRLVWQEEQLAPSAQADADWIRIPLAGARGTEGPLG